MTHPILVVSNKKDEAFLRKKTAKFDFSKFTPREIRDLVATMRRAMREANGIGLSANQIGLDMQVFVAQLPVETGKPKFYAVFNPKLESISDKTIVTDEGCLSVPGTCGRVARADRVVLAGHDIYGKPLKIKAWGLLARIFQHECDHLNGKLFIDRAEKGSIIRETPSTNPPAGGQITNKS